MGQVKEKMLEIVDVILDDVRREWPEAKFDFDEEHIQEKLIERDFANVPLCVLDALARYDVAKMFGRKPGPIVFDDGDRNGLDELLEREKAARVATRQIAIEIPDKGVRVEFRTTHRPSWLQLVAAVGFAALFVFAWCGIENLPPIQTEDIYVVQDVQYNAASRTLYTLKKKVRVIKVPGAKPVLCESHGPVVVEELKAGQ